MTDDRVRDEDLPPFTFERMDRALAEARAIIDILKPREAQ